MILQNELLENLKSDYSGIIIYGAGMVGQIVLDRFLYLEMNVSYIAVTKREKNPFLRMGIPVVCIDEVVEYRDDSAVVIATTRDKQEEIQKKLTSLGFKNVYAMTDDLYFEWKEQDCKEAYESVRRKVRKRYEEPYLKTAISIFEEYNVKIEKREKYLVDAKKNLMGQNINLCRLVIVLGTKCSLRCRDCNNLMPFFKPQTDLDLQDILNSIRKITDAAQSVLKCELIGGEPFLSNNLVAVLESAIDNSTIKSVEITTNGTIIPDRKQTELLKNNKVLVRISDYGTLVNRDNLIKHLKENDINYTVLDLGKWVSPGGVERRGKDTELLKKNYGECSSGYYCKTLYDGKIFACARAASLYALEIMKEKEYVEVKKDFDIAEFGEFLLKDYSIACDYCDIASESKIYVEPAIQS